MASWNSKNAGKSGPSPPKPRVIRAQGAAKKSVDLNTDDIDSEAVEKERERESERGFTSIEGRRSRRHGEK